MGCIAAELYTLRPLFPGSSEIDEMFKICAVMGTPNRVSVVFVPGSHERWLIGFGHFQDEWAEGHMLAAKLSFRWPQCVRSDLKKIIPSSNSDGIDLITATLFWDPKRRPNAAQVEHLRQCATTVTLLPISELETPLLQSQSGSNGFEQLSPECVWWLLVHGFAEIVRFQANVQWRLESGWSK